MFDIAWSELLVIAVVALVVIGPKDLPKAIYTLGKWVGKARVVAREFQTHIDDMMRETELDELRREALKTRDLNLKKMMEDTVDPNNELKTALELPKEIESAGHPGSPSEEPAVVAAAPAVAAPAASDPVPLTSPEAMPAEAPVAVSAASSAASPVTASQPAATTTDKQG